MSATEVRDKSLRFVPRTEVVPIVRTLGATGPVARTVASIVKVRVQLR